MSGNLESSTNTVFLDQICKELWLCYDILYKSRSKFVSGKNEKIVRAATTALEKET
jgi:hypothetical protein